MFVISMGMNFMSYWYSDKIVLAQYNAQQVTAQSNPKLYGMVERLKLKMVNYQCQKYISSLVMYLMHLLQVEIQVMQQLAVTEGIQRLLTGRRARRCSRSRINTC